MSTALHYGLVVGINRYPGVRDLSKPRDDAAGFYTWLTGESGGRVPTDNVIRLTAEPEEEKKFEDALASRPRGDEFQKALIRLHKKLDVALEDNPLAWRDSRLYVYASGHGIAPSIGVGALLFADSDPPSDFWDSAEFGDFRDYYESSGRFREVVFFADCCRERRVLAPTLRPPFSNPTEKHGSADWILGFATEYGDQAFEPPDDEVDQTRGYYTQALLDGLEGGAADRRTGEIRSDSLARYVQTCVVLRTCNTKYSQVPKLATSDAANPMILRPAGLGPLPRKKRSMTFIFPDGFQATVEITLDGEVLPHRWNTAGGPWQIDLEEGVYVVRTDGNGGPATTFRPVEVIAKEQRVELEQER